MTEMFNACVVIIPEAFTIDSALLIQDYQLIW